jgi:hypothetical protein
VPSMPALLLRQKPKDKARGKEGAPLLTMRGVSSRAPGGKVSPKAPRIRVGELRVHRVSAAEDPIGKIPIGCIF